MNYFLTDKKAYVQGRSDGDYLLSIEEGRIKETFFSMLPYLAFEDADEFDCFLLLQDNAFYLSLAKEIAQKVHEGQTDKGGHDYFTGHITSVAEGVETREEKAVAFLHDTVEDTPLPLSDIKRVFPKKIADAVAVLTHNKNEDYFRYIHRVSKNELATAVKLSDLKNNMDMTRLKEVTEEDKKQFVKYKKAYDILRE